MPGLTNSTNSWWWYLHILALHDSTSHIARWCNAVVSRWMDSGTWLCQFPQQLFWTLWRAKGIPSQKPCCASSTNQIFTWWHSTGTILKPWSSTWRSIRWNFIITRMSSVDSTVVHLQRRSWKPRRSSLLWTNRRNWRVTPLRTIYLPLQSVIALMKRGCSSNQTSHNIMLTNCISTLWRCTSETTSLTISASLATSWMQALSSQTERWWIINKRTDTRTIMRPPGRLSVWKPEMRCFSTESSMQILENNVVTMKCL